MHPVGKKLVIDGSKSADKLVLNAASFGFDFVEKPSKKKDRQAVADLIERTNDAAIAANRSLPSVLEVNAYEADWLAKAVAERIVYEACTPNIPGVHELLQPHKQLSLYAIGQIAVTTSLEA